MSTPERARPAVDALAEALAARAERAEPMEICEQAARILRGYGWTCHAPGVGCPPAAPRLPLPTRMTDPATSIGAAPVLPSQRSAAFAVLRVLSVCTRDGMTADELAGVVGRPVWRRVSDLEALGMIEPVPDASDPHSPKYVTRPGRSGRAQLVHRITDKGAAYVAEVRDRLA